MIDVLSVNVCCLALRRRCQRCSRSPVCRRGRARTSRRSRTSRAGRARRCRARRWSDPAHDLAVAHRLDLHRRDADPAALLDPSCCPPRRASRRAAGSSAIHQAPSKRASRSAALSPAHLAVVVSPLDFARSSKVAQPAHRRGRVVELLLAHAGPLDVAEALRPAVARRRRARGRCTRRFDFAKSYISSRKALSPVQRQISATALGNLAVSSVLPASALAPK